MSSSVATRQKRADLAVHLVCRKLGVNVATSIHTEPMRVHFPGDCPMTMSAPRLLEAAGVLFTVLD